MSLQNLTFANISQLVDEQETKYQRRLRNEIDLNELNTAMNTPFSNERYAGANSTSTDNILVNIFSFLLPDVSRSLREMTNNNYKSPVKNKQEHKSTKNKRGGAVTISRSDDDDDSYMDTNAIATVVVVPLVCKRWCELWSYCMEFHQWLVDWHVKRRKKLNKSGGSSGGEQDFGVNFAMSSTTKRVSAKQKKNANKKKLQQQAAAKKSQDLDSSDDEIENGDDSDVEEDDENDAELNSRQTQAKQLTIKANIGLFELPKCFFELPIDRNSVVLDEKIPLVTLSLVYPHSFQFTIWRSLLGAAVFAAKSHESKWNEYQSVMLQNSQFYNDNDSDDGDSDENDDEDNDENYGVVGTESRIVDLPRHGNFSGLYHSIANNGVMMLITHGGYYAGARFVMNSKHVTTGGVEQKEHKTFHKYVVRKKQGKRQVNQDKSKRAKSVGSEMRRLNEKHFKDQLQEHLLEWTDLFRDGDTIVFTHAPGHYNRTLLYKIPDAESPVRPSSCFTIPFATGSQPNNTQVQQAAQKLLQIQVELD